MVEQVLQPPHCMFVDQKCHVVDETLEAYLEYKKENYFTCECDSTKETRNFCQMALVVGR